ncbi:MAG: APC family permease [Actinomycetales bacterium]
MSTAQSDAGRQSALNSSGQDHTLQGNIGTAHLVFTVLAYNGPMVVFLGFIPVSILLGSGVGTPLMLLLCGMVALMFSSGLVAMGLRLPKPGGFYAFVSAGLGKRAGLSSGFAAMLAYYAVNVSAYGLGGAAAETFVQGALHGPEIPWWVYALVMFAGVSLLGYINISFSARVLTVFLALEVALLVAYDVSVLVAGGAHGIDFTSWNPASLSDGSVAIGFIFGIAIYGGFEATIIFRDEVRRPAVTIPRATYTVVITLALLYAISAWVFINAYGPDTIMSVLNEDLVSASSESVRQYTGEGAYVAASVLLITSSFALLIASHNIVARYLFNLSVDGVLPPAISHVHERHGSPHRASATVSAASLFGILVFAFFKVSGDVVYARLSGVYAYTFVILLVLSSLAITAYLRRVRQQAPATRPIVATAISLVFMTIALIIATIHFELLAGTVGWLTVIVLVIVWGIVACGAALAWSLKLRRPEVYARIGRDEMLPADNAHG